MSDQPPIDRPAGAEPPPRECLRCGSPLPSDHPSGLCPACLLQTSPPRPGGAAWTIGPGQRWEPPTPAELSSHFPQLEIEELLGRGGMGAVYRARQKSLDRSVALKVLPPEIARRPGFTDRFSREAQALARFSHPNIVTVFDFGQTGPYAYLLMEHVDGVNLRQVLSDGQLTPEEALGIVPQLCDALQFAHAHGVVHRDIKPENILLDSRGHVKIADFGLAKLASQAGESSGLTGTATIIGTMYYMAPEQIEHPERVDHRADIYSLGVVFYEMLTGELPLGRFQSPSQRVQLDVRLDEVVLRTLEKQPERRYSRAEDIKTEIDEIESTPGASASTAAAATASTAAATAARVPEPWPDRLERYARGAARLTTSAGRFAWCWARQGRVECLAGAALFVQLLFALIAANMRYDQAIPIGLGGIVSLLLARLALHLAAPGPLSPWRWWLISIPLAIVYAPVVLVMLLWPVAAGVVLTGMSYNGVEFPETRNMLAIGILSTMLGLATWWFALAFIAWLYPHIPRFLFRPFADRANGRLARWLALGCFLLGIVATFGLAQTI